MRHEGGFFQWLTTVPYSLLGAGTGNVAALFTGDLNWLGVFLPITVGVLTAVLSAVGVFFTKRFLSRRYKDDPKQLNGADSD